MRAKVESGLPKLTETRDPKKIAERSALLPPASRRRARAPRRATSSRRRSRRNSAGSSRPMRRLARRKRRPTSWMRSRRRRRRSTRSIRRTRPRSGGARELSAEASGVLPELPETVEYRFLGQALVLRDASANLIVDYLPAVAPAEAGRLVMTARSFGLVASSRSRRRVRRARLARRPRRFRARSDRSASASSVISATAARASTRRPKQIRGAARGLLVRYGHHGRRQLVRIRAAAGLRSRSSRRPSRPCSTRASSSTRRSAITTTRISASTSRST